jgi:hypothetical protein
MTLEYFRDENASWSDCFQADAQGSDEQLGLDILVDIMEAGDYSTKSYHQEPHRTQLTQLFFLQKHQEYASQSLPW